MFREEANNWLWQNDAMQSAELIPAEKVNFRGSVKQNKLIQVYNDYGGLLWSLSEMLKLDLAVSLAVICVESGGVAFKDGKMVIRFEPHWFYKLWGKNNRETFDRNFRFLSWKGETHFYRASENDEWQGFHGYQEKEWVVFEIARALHEEAAIQSISMGLGQIMGFNYLRVGYNSAREMFENFSRDARFHILGIFDFMTPRMKAALVEKDYVTFAQNYNGSGQAETYGSLIAGYVQEWSGITS